MPHIIPNLARPAQGLTNENRRVTGHLGLWAHPYQRLEIPTGPLAAGEHELFAALDNRFDQGLQRLALPFYDF